MTLAAEISVPEFRKFDHPDITAKGERRAQVGLKRLETLWFNTGTLCNLECTHCYIESSPSNDSLVFLDAAEVAAFLDEIENSAQPTREIGFTGGEPFMNPDFMVMLEDALERGFEVLVLTNAMRPMMKQAGKLLALGQKYAERLRLRLSLDHYLPEVHDLERGRHSWDRTMPGLKWLIDNGFHLQVAGRTCWDENEADLRAGFAGLCSKLGLAIDAADPSALVLFPEMDKRRDVPEITEACWNILGVAPDQMMCATSRIVVRKKGDAAAIVAPCTLLPFDPQFDLGPNLAEAARPVKLNHPFCAEFCVLGGASCSTHD